MDTPPGRSVRPSRGGRRPLSHRGGYAALGAKSFALFQGEQGRVHHRIPARHQVFDRRRDEDSGIRPRSLAYPSTARVERKSGDPDLKAGVGERRPDDESRRAAVITGPAFFPQKNGLSVVMKRETTSPVVEKLIPSIRMATRPANRGGWGLWIPRWDGREGRTGRGRFFGRIWPDLPGPLFFRS